MPAGRQRPVLQRRIRRHLQPDLGLRVRRLLAGRGQGNRQGRAPAPAARARRHQGRPARPAGREDLHRVQPYAARHAGRAGRPDPRDRAPAERHRGDRHGRDQGRARLGPRRRRAGHGRAAGRAALQRQRPHAHPVRRGRDQARLPGPAADLDALQGQAGDRAGRRHGAGRQRADPGQGARAGDGRGRGAACRSASPCTSVANQPEVVDKSFEEFISSLLEALAIVLVVSFISLGVRTGVIVALSVPLVLAITFVGMMLLGIDFQRISLGALIIALGLLVDDAIIAVEMMMVKLEQGASRLEAATYAYTSTAFPMLTGTLVTAVGFVPVGFARSSAGEYTNSIFWVVGLSLIISWFVAVLFTPWMGYHLLPQPKVHHADPYDGRLYRIFRRLVVWCVTWRKTTIAITALAFVASLGAFTLVQKQFFPTANRPELIVDMKLAQGASWKATDSGSAQAREMAGREPRRRLLHGLCRRRQPALLPADRARARQRQFRPGHRHDQGPRRARARLRRSRQAVRERLRGGARPRAAAAERPAGRLPRDVPRAGRRSAAGPRRGRTGAAGLQGRSGHARRQFRLERARQDGAARGRPEQGARARRRFADPGQHAADPAVGRDRDAVPRAHRDRSTWWPARWRPSG